MSYRVRRLLDELKHQSPEYIGTRLEEELRLTEPVDSQRLHENALVMTELRKLGVWPPRS